MSTATPTTDSTGHAQRSRWALMLGALGVVYGDIGTSPLYAMKECFSPDSPHHVASSSANVLGILSLIFWSLTTVVTLKYLMFIMRADNEGKGGIMALLALLPQRGLGVARGALVLVVLFGASLLSGEGVITPAIRGGGLSIELRSTSYYLGRETLLSTGTSGMSRWRKALFAFISRNARPATAYFGLPPNRVVELGMQIDL
jgi:K+ transporter